MTVRRRFLVAAVALLSGALAHAQPHMRPGLWEETVNVKSDDAQANAAMAQMKERLANMPPEQRAMMEKMMASHGIGMGGAPNAMRICVTKEQAARGFNPEQNSRDHCTRSNVNTSGHVVSFDFACKSENSSVTGHGTFTDMGDSAFAAHTVADTVTPKRTMHLDSDIQGHFVSADCGDVKPVTPPPAH